MKHKVIITGSTGMVGKGVLYECLEDVRIEEVLVINRHSLGRSERKLREILLEDITELRRIGERLSEYDACFFCMGVSAMGMSEEKYTALTFDLVKRFVDRIYDKRPDMVFNYVSGTGTDSSEEGSIMWARVKGRTENYILNKGFKDAYMFRPGVIIPEKGIQTRVKLYRTMYSIMKPLYPLLRRLSSITTTTRIGQAMINSLDHPQELKKLENKDINALAEVPH